MMHDDGKGSRIFAPVRDQRAFAAVFRIKIVVSISSNIDGLIFKNVAQKKTSIFAIKINYFIKHNKTKLSSP